MNKKVSLEVNQSSMIALLVIELKFIKNELEKLSSNLESSTECSEYPYRYKDDDVLDVKEISDWIKISPKAILDLINNRKIVPFRDSINKRGKVLVLAKNVRSYLFQEDKERKSVMGV